MPISNNKPRDHHYIPVFYLKQWRGLNKKLSCFAGTCSGTAAHPVETGGIALPRFKNNFTRSQA